MGPNFVLGGMIVQLRSQSATSSKALWAGRIISGLVTLFLILDGIVKVIKAAPAMEGSARLGLPLGTVAPIGVVLLLCVALYSIPRTSLLGAILLTGYLGGATAIQVRVLDRWFLFPVGFGVLIWAGLYLRDLRLRTLIHGQ
jgi:DoxX-like family